MTLWLNTSCHRIYQKYVKDGIDNKESWKELCELWASDLRTHITEDRWSDAVKRIVSLNGKLILLMALRLVVMMKIFTGQLKHLMYILYLMLVEA
jgi:hypothetical protein